MQSTPDDVLLLVRGGRHQWSITMGVVLVSWIFFRAEGLSDVFEYFHIVFEGLYNKTLFDFIIRDVALTQINDLRFFIVTFSIIIIEVIQILQERKLGYCFPENTSTVFYSILIWMIVLFGNFGLEEFIYFQF